MNGTRWLDKWRGGPSNQMGTRDKGLRVLLNEADPSAPRAPRHLWLIRIVAWLRRGQTLRKGDVPGPVIRLRHLLDQLDGDQPERARVAHLLQQALPTAEITALFADLGFAGRRDLWGELGERLRLRLLPDTPDTSDLSRLFGMMFSHPGDAQWLAAIDDDTLERLLALLRWPVVDTPTLAAPDSLASPSNHDPHVSATGPWRVAVLEAISYLLSAVRAASFEPTLRRRMDPALLQDRPFERLVRTSEDLMDAMAAADRATIIQQANQLRGQLDQCRLAADSVYAHLEAYGVSVNLVFELDQLRRRIERVEALLALVLDPQPGQVLRSLVAELVRTGHERRSVRALLHEHYHLLARKVAERSAETGEHYITRTGAEYRDMLARALGGGAVIAGTTFAKYGIAALALSSFWGGWWAGVNYAASFVLIQLLHWTVATKQPAMTAPAMAAKLADVDTSDVAVESFVDEVTHLIRSQIAGIVGNLAMVAPLVLAVQSAFWWFTGQPLVGEASARYSLHALTLLGPTVAYAAFTGVLLFLASLIAGWVENWFVWHRLDSAIAWNPRIVRVLGAARAQRWSVWWRANISGLAANTSLGLLLGLVPAVAGFFGLPLEVRHVTLGTGQIAAALGALGPAALHSTEFWWCVAAVPLIGGLNLLVSFVLAFRVALSSRGLKVRQRDRLYAALWRRLKQAPRSFLLPPRA